MNLELILLRHGKTIANEEHRYIGSTDQSLSESGIRELESAAGKWKEYGHSKIHVFSSPMKRCTETAGIVFEEEFPEIIMELKETDFGEFEMKNHAELDGNSDYQAWIDSNGTIAFPGGESRAQFIERTMEGFRKLLERCREQGITQAAATVHGGSIMAIMHSMTGEDYYNFLIGNGQGYVLELNMDESPKLIDYRRF